VDVKGDRGSPPARWLAVPAAAAVSWAATTLRPFTHPAFAVTLLTGIVVVALGSRARKRRPLDPPPAGRTLALWIALFAALALWELIAFLQLPRVDHPTLSSLANSVFDSHLIRATAFAAWIAAGFGIARR
jgi:hypothetical protein